MTVPPYSFNKKSDKDLCKTFHRDRDDIDRLVSAQLVKGPTVPQIPDRCPNPWHPVRWHGFPEGSCPGSHVGVYEEPEEDSPRVFNYFT